MPRAILCLSLLASCTALIGCGGPQRPPVLSVSGQVLLNNEPIEGAAVMFIPVDGGRPAQGVTDAQGAFRLTTFDTNDGALLGDHQVTVTKVEVTGVTETEDGLSGVVDAGQIQQIWVVPQRYALAETSGLTARVEKGMKPPKFELTSP